MLIKKTPDIKSSEITPESTYINRRRFIEIASGLSIAASSASAWAQTKRGPYDTDEKQTPYKDVTTYNNFYEFGTDKGDPARTAKNFRAQPWTISVDGLVRKPQVYAFDDLIRGMTIEDRVYRMRCVEGWSMVIPWQGFQLIRDGARPASGVSASSSNERRCRSMVMPTKLRRCTPEWI